MARDPKYDVLFEPIRIGPKTMKNRFYQTPHCIGATSDQPATIAAFRGMKAEGGWGGVCTEACTVDPEVDSSPSALISLWDDGDVLNLRPMCDAVHSHGALAATELIHFGVSSPNLTSRAIAWAPSEATSDHMIASYTHEVDEDDMEAFQNLFVLAAKRGVQAGFDIIYLHGGAGDLPQQFLSKHYNRRTDKYGGSFENRARYYIETLDKMKRAIGDDCALGVRYSADQLMGPDGVEAGDDAARFVEYAEKEGLVDLWDVNICDLTEWGEDAGPSRFYQTNHEAPFTKFIKDQAKAPVINVGRFTNPDDMIQVLNSGQADIIGAARPSIADPFLPKKIEEGRLDDIRECIGCNICVSRWERGTPLVCTQNATSMEEFRRGWHPEKFDQPEDLCSVLVVGAGPAGMECARVLGERGYTVHLCEADDEIGGHVRDVIRYPGLAEWGRVISYRQIQLDKLKNVEVHTGVGKMSADDVLAYGADRVVIATGSHWVTDGYGSNTMAPVPGIDASLPQFCTPEQVMAGKEVGDRVVVLDADGYFTGVGMAELMVDQGKQVSIVTQFDAVAPITAYTLEGPNIHRMMFEKGIRIYPLHWAEGVVVNNSLKVRTFYVYRDGYQRFTDPVPGQLPRRQGTKVTELDCDTVILVTGRRSNSDLYRALKARKGEWEKEGILAIHRAGDCFAPRVLSEAIFDGHRIAREFESPNPERMLPYLRERTIWGQGSMPTLDA